MRLVLISTGLGLASLSLHAADWPMWRHDAGRTAATDQQLLAEPKLLWTRELPPLKPAFRDVRLQFDAGYEPIVLGKRMFVASTFDDSVTAFDTSTGEQLWKFYAEGPIRFAPVGGQGRVIFGSDDGNLYCVKASDGALVWKFKAVPSKRTLLGNGRLISVWPVRGGPVLKDDRVYFAAGVWPLEGVFVYCLDTATGDVIWLNDRASYIYGQHPHNAEAFGGLAPQGYLLIDGDDLVVPSSSAFPARFDLATGELKEFELPAAGRLTGGYFAATHPSKEQRRGLVFDSDISTKRHEDKPRSEGQPEVRTTISTRDGEFRFADGFPGVEGEIHSMVAADAKLFVTTVEGKIHAFGGAEADPRRYALEKPPALDSDRARQLLEVSGAKNGYAIALGESDANFLGTLVEHSELRVAAVDSGATFRSYPAERLSFVTDVELPPYFADLMVTGILDPDALRKAYRSLRPFGGVLAGPPELVQVAMAAKLPGATFDVDSGFTLIRKAGALDGSTNYTGDWVESSDALVKAPLGVLWFDDAVSHFKRAPQPKFVDGVMISADKDWTDASTRAGKVDYRLLEPRFTDVYSGRPFGPDEVPVLRQSFGKNDRETIQPSQYRPPTQKDDWKPEQPKNGVRISPLTGLEESRVFPKSYGCDGGIDYGHLFTMRSGTAAFYDKQIESGTINISGPRSGCTNSVIPANGVLNIPYFYEGCTCSYPLPMALALVSMPETFEQWMSWGEVPAEQLLGKIQRVGINFGAPGDRKTEDGTLWLDYPSIGGPSPEIRVITEPAEPEFFYRHSIWMKDGGDGWPWVAASGVRGLRSVKIEGFKPGVYEVRLTVAAPKGAEVKPFDVGFAGKLTETINLAEPMRPMTKSFTGVEIDDDGALTLELSEGSVLSGIEVIPTK